MESKTIHQKLFSIMQRGGWLTAWEIKKSLGRRYSDSTITARIRDLRKPQYGGHTVSLRLRNGSGRTREYRLCK